MNFSGLNEWIQSVTNDDIVRAMQEIPGYLDITPSDFMEVYRVALDHAVQRLKTAIKAKDVMSGNVVTVLKNETLEEIVRKLAVHDISGLPVLDEYDGVVGVISEKDIVKKMNDGREPSFMRILLQCLESTDCLAAGLKKLAASDLMSCPPLFVENETPVFEVANMMDRNNINRVPVLDKQSRLIGIIARSDLVQTMC